MEGLKKKMTFEQMAEHMRRNSYRTVNRVNVGLYAKRHGYTVYKPMIDGKIHFFYVNMDIEDGD